MRNFNKLWAVVLVLVLSASCGDLFELDLQDNPNEVSVDQAGPDFVYNSIQLSAISVFDNFQGVADGLARHTYMASFTYNSELPATTGNGAWNNAYANLYPDVDAMNAVAASNPALEVYAQTANILKAYVMMSLVDFFGDVPLTEALNGTDIISPKSDPGADTYAAAEELLKTAVEVLSATEAVAPADDMFYAGDITKWVTLARTLQLRIGVNTRLVGGASKIAAIVSGGDFIDDASEDFQFATGTERDNPNSRHPFYNNHYETSDGTYMNNYFMWQMCCEKDEVVDPRIRHYFYRQVPDADGQEENVYSCVYSTLPDPAATPQWFLDVDPRMPYCIASADYYGRDHGNGGGIPPDGQIRTTYGLFPGGGKWDNNSFDVVQNSGTDGALGEGIAPILTSYMVAFLRAEAALASSTGEDARALLEDGVRGSIAKVRSFEGRIPAVELNYVIGTDIDGNEILASTLIVADSTVDEYVQFVLDDYDAADATGKLDIVMTEAYIANVGNAAEVYNSYRRTGMPMTMQPGLDAAVGPFARSILYASDNVNLNQTVTQKGDLLQLVFWDDGSSTVR